MKKSKTVKSKAGRPFARTILLGSDAFDKFPKPTRIVTETKMVIGPGVKDGILLILSRGTEQFSHLLSKKGALFIGDELRNLAEAK